jgi:amino acid transporter
LLGLLVTTALLVAAMLAYGRVGSVAGFAAHQTDAMSYVADRIGGRFWHLIIVATVLVSTAATLWTTILYLSRSAYAMGRAGVLPHALGRLDARGVPANSLVTVFGCTAAFTLLTGCWPTAASVLNLVLNGTSVFLGVLFAMSALAAIKLVRARSGSSWFSGVGVPLFGAVTLCAIIAVDIAQSDTVTRGIEVGGLLLGAPFALWRSGGVEQLQYEV